MRFASIGSIVLLVLMLCATGGCGKKVSEMVADKVTEEVIESAMEKDGQKADVKIDSQTGSMTVKTEDGDTTSTYTSSSEGVTVKTEGGPTVTIGKDAKVPEGFPQDIPVYAGLEITMSSGDPANHAFSVQGLTADAVDKVGAFYQKEMKAQGWTEAQAVTQGGAEAMQMFSFEKADATAMVMVNSESGKTTVTISAGMQ